MDSLVGIASALALIGLGLFVMVGILLRRRRIIEAYGYEEDERENIDLNKLCLRLFDHAAEEINVREEPDGQSWLVHMDVGGSDDPGCVMLVYPIAGLNCPAMAIVQSGRQIPKIFRRLTGGVFSWAEPLEEAQTQGLDGTGWFAYVEPNATVPSSVLDKFSKAMKIPKAKGLLGVAFIAPYLAIWTDTDRVETLLSVGPSVRRAVRDPESTS